MSSRSTNLCRLCAVKCRSDFKSLRDERGQVNQLYELTYKYFHPTIVDFEVAKDVTSICQKCCDHMWEFHHFQLTVREAQIKFADYQRGVEIKTEPEFPGECQETGDPNVVEILNDPSVVKLETETECLTLPAEGTQDTNEFDQFIVLEDIGDTSGYVVSQDKDLKLSIVKAEEECIPLPMETMDANKKENLNKYEISQDYEEHSEEVLTDPIAFINDEKTMDKEDSLVEEDTTKELLDIHNSSDDDEYGDELDAILQMAESEVLTRRMSSQPAVWAKDLKAMKDNGASADAEAEVLSAHETDTFAKDYEKLKALTVPDIKCVVCSQSWPDFILHRQHFRDEHPSEVFYIRCCNHHITQLSDFEEHLLLHKYPNAFKCKYCGVCYGSNKVLLSHVTKSHSEAQALKQSRRKSLDHEDEDAMAVSGSKKVKTAPKTGVPREVPSTSAGCTVELSRAEEHPAISRPELDRTDIEECWPQELPTSAEDATPTGSMAADSKPNSKFQSDANEIKSSELDRMTEEMPQLKCIACPETFQNLPQLNTHFRQQHPSEEYYIECCSCKFSPRTMKEHLELHKDPYAFRCDLCGIIYESSAGLRYHLTSSHPGSLNFSCKICGKGYNTRKGLQIHRFVVHGIDPPANGVLQADGRTVYTCLECGHNSYSLKSYRNHKSQRHLCERAAFNCTICSKRFTRSQFLREHLASHQKKYLYTCQYCPKQFRWLANIYIHRQKVHPHESKRNCYKKIDDTTMEADGTDPNNSSDPPAEATTTSVDGATATDDLLVNTKSHISLPKLEIMDVNSDSSELSSDDDVQSDDGKAKQLNALLAKWMPDMKCVACPETYQHFTALKDHFKHQHPQDDFYIECCSRKYKTRIGIRDHLHRHQDPNAFKCNLCDKTYESSTGLRQHETSAHPVSYKFPCKMCDKGTDTRKGLEIHLSTVHKIEPRPRRRLQVDGRPVYTCHECGHISYTVRSHRTHRSEVHLRKRAPSFQCNLCSQSFVRSRSLREHLAGHQKTDIYACAYCPKKFRWVANIYRHRQKVHPQESNQDCYTKIAHSTDETFSADDIRQPPEDGGALEPEEPSTSAAAAHRDERSKNSSGMELMDLNSDTEFSSDDDVQSSAREGKSPMVEKTLHELLAKWMPRIKCVSCPETFEELGLLKIHFSQQHPGDDFYIECCARKYRVTVGIKEHLLFHEDPDTFKCNMCGKKYVSSSGLRVHLTEIHPESHKFACVICGKGFNKKGGLDMHLSIVHRFDQRPKWKVQSDGRTVYTCKDCGHISYKIWLHRKHRSDMHLPKRALQCTTCSKVFATARALREHSVSHPNKRIYACAYCPKKFSRMVHIINHRKRVHPQANNKKFYTKLDDNADDTFADEAKSDDDSGKDTYPPNLGVEKDSKEPNIKPEYDMANLLYSESEELGTAVKDAESTADFAVAEKCLKTMDVNTDTEFTSDDDDVPLATRYAKRQSSAKIESHLETNKFKCKICAKIFRHNKGLEIHYTKIHKPEGGTAYSCRECDKKFYTEKDLLQHIWHTHRSRPGLECAICDKKGFRVIIQLREHMAAHRNRDIYTCVYCPQRFRRATDVVHHRQEEHPQESKNKFYKLIPEAISYQREPEDFWSQESTINELGGGSSATLLPN